MAGSGPMGPSCAGRGGQGTTRRCSRRRSGGPCSGSSCAAASSRKTKPRACSSGPTRGFRSMPASEYPRTIAPSLSGWRGTAPAIRSHWSGSRMTRGRAGHLPLRQDRWAHGRDRHGGPGRVLGPGGHPHSQSGPGHAALLRLVRQPDPGARRQQGLATAGSTEGGTVVEAVAWSALAARARWAELLRRIFEVDPLTCPRCQRAMRVVAVITDATVIARILAHRVRARDPTSRPRSPSPLRRRSPPPTAAGRPHP
jgi:hypothetical protein